LHGFLYIAGGKSLLKVFEFFSGKGKQKQQNKVRRKEKVKFEKEVGSTKWEVGSRKREVGSWKHEVEARSAKHEDGRKTKLSVLAPRRETFFSSQSAKSARNSNEKPKIAVVLPLLGKFSTIITGWILFHILLYVWQTGM